LELRYIVKEDSQQRLGGDGMFSELGMDARIPHFDSKWIGVVSCLNANAICLQLSELKTPERKRFGYIISILLR